MNITMQGTVYESLLYTASLDKPGQHVYNNSELIYKYKVVVELPVLGIIYSDQTEVL